MDSFNNQGEQGFNSGSQNQVQSTGQEDYVDKGLDAFEKKEGLPENRGINEKITDTARNMFEKDTGVDVPDKFSN
ncbi:unnamed protein product [Peniophora sp. CBMAI 1063]|nr:unnamed protein product [Peniophora sp. CBMAI 1063]